MAHSSFGYYRMNARGIPSSNIDPMAQCIFSASQLTLTNVFWFFQWNSNTTVSLYGYQVYRTTTRDSSSSTLTVHLGDVQSGQLSGPLVEVIGLCNCDGTIPPNAGCGIQERSRASYREDFNLQGGGVFSMRWDENRIAVGSFFHAAIPADIVRSTPNPYTMGFTIFDITIGGNKSGCPGACANQLKDPSNFEHSFFFSSPGFATAIDSSNTIAIAPRDLMFATVGRMLVVAVMSNVFGHLVLSEKNGSTMVSKLRSQDEKVEFEGLE
ncbi:hypothetical protein K435DRAFT_811713 [Dendrothele bispora CBS 962.96]|uniref:Uncharacterized protein n=1 Tax=Dendrothele bispora (strain CBS 962.96) TaxID=1314807 RepID=A0A4S8KR66_DENBC|nr:hypothetical protein K435DRAFT_811713 [Dendrothele bispora CBS 962.96]